MSTCLQPDPNFDELVQRVLNGEASRRDIKILNSTITNDEAARKHYVEMSMLHNALDDHFQGALAESPASEQIIPFPEGTQSAQIQSTRSAPRGKPIKFLAIAATIALIASIWAVINFSDNNSGLVISSGPAMSPGPALYEVISLRGADMDTMPEKGDSLHEGQIIRLKQGIVEISSNDGNTLLLQGPAELKIVKQDHLMMESGHLFAELNGAPLKIEVPNGVITDLGTTFGVHQESRFSTRVDVFDGRVRFADPEQPSLAVEVSKGESVQLQGSEWNPVIDKANRSLYPVTDLIPLGFTFANTSKSADEINSSTAHGVAWTASAEPYGSLRLAQGPVEVKWVGSHLWPLPYSGSKKNLGIPQSRLCAKKWDEEDRAIAAGMGFDPNRNGAILQFSNLNQWLEQVGATKFTVTLWTTIKNPDSKRSLSEIKMYVSNSLTDDPVFVWQQDIDHSWKRLEPVNQGVIAKQIDHHFTDDHLTINLPIENPDSGPSHVVAVILTPVTGE